MPIPTHSQMMCKLFDDFAYLPLEKIREAIQQSKKEFDEHKLYAHDFETYWIAYADSFSCLCQIERIRNILNGVAKDSDLPEYKKNIQHSLDLLDMLTVFDGKYTEEEKTERLNQRVKDMQEFAKKFKPFHMHCEAWIEANINEKFRRGAVA